MISDTNKIVNNENGGEIVIKYLLRYSSLIELQYKCLGRFSNAQCNHGNSLISVPQQFCDVG